MAQVSLENVNKWFGSVPAVRDVSLEIEDGEFAVLVGPSGCGKTTTLRMIAGLEEISSGTIRFDGEVVNELPPKARDIAMVFQSYALYPQMTVAQNMAFSLKMKRRPRAEAMEAVRHAAELLNISELLERKPRELSGGQRQRVAMGRAIVRRPRAFLFDEPLSNLDAALRSQMRVEIKRIHQRLETTVIYVTHDQIEAMTLADRIVVMNNGEIAQMGAPMAVYEKPITKFVAGFIGSPRMNFLRTRLVEDATGNGLAAELSHGVRLAIPGDRTTAYRRYVGRSVEIGLRPEHVTEEPLQHPNAASFEASVDVIEPTGSVMLVFCSIDDQVFTAHGDPHVAKRPGQLIRLHADMGNMHLVDLENDRIVPV
ncbi:MAG: ABC transporter ATP-binding protein [Alphaproteobacteria bacterium]